MFNSYGVRVDGRMSHPILGNVDSRLVSHTLINWQIFDWKKKTKTWSTCQPFSCYSFTSL